MLFSLQQASDVIPSAATSPYWMAATGLAISGILALIRIVEFLASRSLRANLSVSLTRDLFFRYTRLGETLFINGVLFTTDKPAMITDIRGTLRRKDGTKSFHLTFTNFGEPTNRGGAIYDHYFFSSSPIDLLPTDVPVRRIYMCVLTEYQSQLSGAATKLESEITRLTPRIRDADRTSGQPDVALAADVKVIRDEFMSTYIDGVQLEQAEYLLDLEYDYRPPKAKVSETDRTARASLEFRVGQSVRDFLRVELTYADFLVLRALDQRDDVYQFPVVTPDNVQPRLTTAK